MRGAGDFLRQVLVGWDRYLVGTLWLIHGNLGRLRMVRANHELLVRVCLLQATAAAWRHQGWSAERLLGQIALRRHSSRPRLASVNLIRAVRVGVERWHRGQLLGGRLHLLD